MKMANSCPDMKDLDLAEAYSLAITLEDAGYNFYNQIIEKIEKEREKPNLPICGMKKKSIKRSLRDFYMKTEANSWKMKNRISIAGSTIWF
jgi:DNA-binding XRE family transcriptional regulator